jgi:hypothetical protein
VVYSPVVMHNLLTFQGNMLPPSSSAGAVMQRVPTKYRCTEWPQSPFASSWQKFQKVTELVHIFFDEV